MRYILLIELENTNFTSSKIQGLQQDEWAVIEREFKRLNLTYVKQQNFIEVDTPGIQVLNILVDNQYEVVSQSMTMEKSNIGSRIIQTQKLVWTLCKK